jgi:hypothetical protein
MTGYVYYYESIKRELKRRLIHEYRCDERLKTKKEESTRLSDTGLVVELEHLKTKYRVVTWWWGQKSYFFLFFDIFFPSRYENIRPSHGLLPFDGALCDNTRKQPWLVCGSTWGVHWRCHAVTLRSGVWRRGRHFVACRQKGSRTAIAPTAGVAVTVWMCIAWVCVCARANLRTCSCLVRSFC